MIMTSCTVLTSCSYKQDDRSESPQRAQIIMPSVLYAPDTIRSIRVQGIGLGTSYGEAVKIIKSQGSNPVTRYSDEPKDLYRKSILVSNDDSIDKWYGSKMYEARYVFGEDSDRVVAIFARYYPKDQIPLKHSTVLRNYESGGIFSKSYYIGSEGLFDYENASFPIRCSRFYQNRGIGGRGGSAGRSSRCTQDDNILKQPYIYISKSRSSNYGFDNNDMVMIVEGSYFYQMRSLL